MEENKAFWKRKYNRFYNWNECSACGFKSFDAIFGEQIKPDQCPKCGKQMSTPKKEASKTNAESQPVYRRCRTTHCIIEKESDSQCYSCGFFEYEFRRRLALPWKKKNGLYYKDISMKLEDQDDR